MPHAPLNIVWRRQVLETVLESSFIQTVLLSKINRPQRWIAIEESDDLPMMDDLLVVSFGDPVSYFEALKDRGCKNIGFFQVGDEHGDKGCASYIFADYVLRNYHFPEPLAEKPGLISWVPNGWARGVGPVVYGDHLSFFERAVPAFFSGFIGQGDDKILDRIMMLKVIRDNDIEALTATTSGFGQGLGPAAYAAHMGNTRYSLTPSGRSPETIRFYDALELGAIPIVIDGNWLHAKDGLGALGRPPIAILNNWTELPLFLKSQTDLNAAEKQRLDCVQWWHKIKEYYSNKVAKLING
jgi:hypothetical protein